MHKTRPATANAHGVSNATTRFRARGNHLVAQNDEPEPLSAADRALARAFAGADDFPLAGQASQPRAERFQRPFGHIRGH